jgi:hypothetical protein
VSIEITTLDSSYNDEEESPMETAIIDSGLFGIAKAPRFGTEAYNRLMAAASGYMAEVKKVEQQPTPDPTYNSEDNYYKSTKKDKLDFYLRDSSIRRKFHDIMAKMLLGKSREELSGVDAEKISDFAAYITGNEHYAGTFSVQ